MVSVLRVMSGAVMALLLSVACQAAPANNPNAEKEFGKALPPIGFVRFCAENRSECKSVGRRAEALQMNDKRWTYLYQVNTYVNGKIAPMSDMELYGQSEYWTYPVDAGDCEDYLLLKKRELEKLGFDSGALLITVVLDEKQEGHAVLTVVTDHGDYILDNRRNDILLWKDTGYTFLKRQSAKDARQWMALTDSKTIPVRTVAGN